MSLLLFFCLPTFNKIPAVINNILIEVCTLLRIKLIKL